MTPGELLHRFRLEMVDTVEPYLWSDEEVFAYANSAQSMLARLTGGIADSSSYVTEIEVVPGETWYDLSPKVLKVRTVTLGSTGRRLDVVSPETAQDKGYVFRPGLTGEVRAVVTGLEDGKARVWPVPTKADVLNLSVLRMPFGSIDGEDSRIEVPEQHHEHLLLWMKSRAYLKPDAETFDKSKAQEFEGAFRAYCSFVQAELSRQRRSAGTTTYGGL